MNHGGTFVISLDFELLWGVRDKRTVADYGANILGVRRVIPAIARFIRGSWRRLYLGDRGVFVLC